MVGASVLVKGTAIGIVSDIDGKYNLSVPADAKVLVFSFAGYQTEEVALTGSSVVDVSLKESTLQEVVVTAQGIKKRKKPWVMLQRQLMRVTLQQNQKRTLRAPLQAEHRVL
ncbi:MAG: hypothetical protein HC817_04355 [Saprospiraceae bacterium]|nr:hypothetical protein [Saprospiraceae bacterium]